MTPAKICRHLAEVLHLRFFFYNAEFWSGRVARSGFSKLATSSNYSASPALKPKINSHRLKPAIRFSPPEVIVCNLTMSGSGLDEVLM